MDAHRFSYLVLGVLLHPLQQRKSRPSTRHFRTRIDLVVFYLEQLLTSWYVFSALSPDHFSLQRLTEVSCAGITSSPLPLFT